MFDELFFAVVPLAAPAVSEVCDAIDQEHVEFLVCFLVDEGQLRDAAS
jgi:hypothetical protein